MVRLASPCKMYSKCFGKRCCEIIEPKLTDTQCTLCPTNRNKSSHCSRFSRSCGVILTICRYVLSTSTKNMPGHPVKNLGECCGNYEVASSTVRFLGWFGTAGIIWESDLQHELDQLFAACNQSGSKIRTTNTEILCPFKNPRQYMLQANDNTLQKVERLKFHVDPILACLRSNQKGFCTSVWRRGWHCAMLPLRP